MTMDLLEVACQRFPKMRILHRIDGALTNKVYRIEWQSKQAFLKIRNQDDLPGRLSAKEEVAATLAAGSLAAPLLHADSQFVVTSLVPQPDGLVEPGQLGRALAKLHLTPAPPIRRLTMVELLGSLILTGPLAIHVFQRDQLLLRLGSDAPAVRLCHQDIHAGNLGQGPEGVVFFDWEYAAVGDCRFDVFCAMRIFPAAAAAVFWQAYQAHGGPSPRPDDDVAAAVALVDDHWHYWHQHTDQGLLG